MSDINNEDFDLEDNLDDIVDESVDDPNYDLGYQVGFDAGYIEGYEEGQATLSLEKESALYNTALADVIAQVNKFDFPDKDNMIMVLQLLQRV